MTESSTSTNLTTFNTSAHREIPTKIVEDADQNNNQAIVYIGAGKNSDAEALAQEQGHPFIAFDPVEQPGDDLEQTVATIIDVLRQTTGPATFLQIFTDAKCEQAVQSIQKKGFPIKMEIVTPSSPQAPASESHSDQVLPQPQPGLV